MQKGLRQLKHSQETTDMKKLLIYGAGGNGRVCADIAKLNGYEDVLFFDDDLSKNTEGKYRVIHSLDEMIDIEEYDFFNAIGSNKTREITTDKWNKELITLIHPSAVIGEDVEIGKGVAIMANVVINTGTRIGNGVIVNTYASLDHDNIIDDYAHISVNVHTAGTVHVGKRTFVGIGSTVSNNISICDDAVVGAGAVVVSNIEESGTYIGVPAKKKQ